MDSRFLQNCVVTKFSPVLELLPGKDEPLLVRGDTLLVLDLGLDVFDGVGVFHLESQYLTGQ